MLDGRKIRGRQRDKQLAIRIKDEHRTKLDAIAASQRWTFAETVKRAIDLLDENLKRETGR